MPLSRTAGLGYRIHLVISIVMRVISVIGASGFIGRHVLKSLLGRQGAQIRVLVRKKPTESEGNNVSFIEGDLFQPASLDMLLEPGCSVINLAYLGSCTPQDNLDAMANLADACARRCVKRLIHCSTAVVVGKYNGKVADEGTPCSPSSEYEETKLKVEQLLLTRSRNRFETVVLRPTAVFGQGGKNLLKLADQVSTGNRFIGYLKSCVYYRRSMNLVCVENVVAALLFLLDVDKGHDGNVFIVSDDDAPLNNYRGIEILLMKKMGKNPYILPIVPIPATLLGWVLRLSGKTQLNPLAKFSTQKLENAGYRKAIRFDAALENFADWCQTSAPRSDENT